MPDCQTQQPASADADTRKKCKNWPIISAGRCIGRSLTVWQHIEFNEVEGRINKTYTACKICGTQLNYFGNTTNLRNHLARYHPELGEKQWPVADASQRTVEQVVVQLQPNSERTKWITKSIASFTALDLRLYSVVKNVGFQTMVFTLEPRYKISFWRYFPDTAIQTLYSETSE